MTYTLLSKTSPYGLIVPSCTLTGLSENYSLQEVPIKIPYVYCEIGYKCQTSSMAVRVKLVLNRDLFGDNKLRNLNQRKFHVITERFESEAWQADYRVCFLDECVCQMNGFFD